MRGLLTLTWLEIKIFVREQQLCDVKSVAAQEALITMHEVRLADCSARLQRDDVFGALSETEWLETG